MSRKIPMIEKPFHFLTSHYIEECIAALVYNHFDRARANELTQEQHQELQRLLLLKCLGRLENSLDRIAIFLENKAMVQFSFKAGENEG